MLVFMLAIVNVRPATPHFVVQSTGAVVTNDILNLGSSRAEKNYPYILGQFDGGCHSSLAIGGAGYCVYLVYPDAVKLIRWNSIALPNCSDNVVAEVSSCRFLVQEIVSLCRGQLVLYLYRETFCPLLNICLLQADCAEMTSLKTWKIFFPFQVDGCLWLSGELFLEKQMS